MNIGRMYAIGRLAFGAASLAFPARLGRALAGAGGSAPDAQAFLRGMGGREIGLGLGLWVATRTGASIRPWLVAGLLADGSDLTGIAGAWPHMPPTKRLIGLATAGGALTAGIVVLASTLQSPSTVG